MRKTCAMEAGHAGFVRARESVEGEVVQELAYGVEKYCACGFAESGRIWRRAIVCLSGKAGGTEGPALCQESAGVSAGVVVAREDLSGPSQSVRSRHVPLE